GSVANGGDDRRRSLWAYSPYLREAAARLARAEDLLDPSIEPGNLLVEGAEEGVELCQHRTEELADLRSTILQQGLDLASSPRDRLGECDASVEQQAAHLGNQRRPMIHQPLPAT